MNDRDPLSELLKTWKPASPHTTAKFVNDTMRRIRLAQVEPWWITLAHRWDGFLQAWLPSPRILLPVAASFIVVLSVLAWNHVERRAETIAAMQWRDELSRPFSKLSLSGTYAELSRDPMLSKLTRKE